MDSLETTIKELSVATSSCNNDKCDSYKICINPEGYVSCNYYKIRAVKDKSLIEGLQHNYLMFYGDFIE